ncbi:MAG: heavy metal translocating P-type ATPase, partial [Actinomycetota bacterium]
SLFPRSDSAQVHEDMDHDTMDMSSGSASSSDGAHHEIYLEVATTLTAFLLAGRYFEVRSRRRAGAALRALLNLGAKEATLWRDGVETTVPIAALAVGDVFVVRPGETVATDGVVTEGSSAIDRSMVTGESVPVDAVVGDTVTGGTLNTTGRMLVRATRIGRDTVLAQMARLVEKAQEGKAPVQRLADRVSAVFVPFVMGLALVTLVVWLIVTGDTERSFQVAVSVLIIACPCALGLATPVALLVGTGRAARDGIIIKGAHVLEATQAVDVIVLDKTGTITTGQMTLEDVEFLGSLAGASMSGEQRSLLAAAMAVERRSEHPLARAIVRGLQDREIDDSACVVTEFESLPGVGVSALVDGVRVTAGRAGDAGARHGATVIDVQRDGVPVVRFAVRDQPRVEAAGVISELRALGVKP